VRTLVAFEEAAAEGEPSRVVLHQYEVPISHRGRETFALQASPRDQRRPVLGHSMVAWVEEEPNGGAASLWYQALFGHEVGTSYSPQEPAERIADVAPGTSISIFHSHVFHIIVWTAPDGRLKGVFRSLLARIGYDPSPFYLSDDAAINPATDNFYGDSELIAYNHPATNTIRATMLWGMAPQPAIDIAPAGASAPRVINTGKDYIVFWSMQDGGTYAQRVGAADGIAFRIGEPRRIHDGTLHDVTRGQTEEYFLTLARGARFAFVRLDADLDVTDDVAFGARLAGGKISVSTSAAVETMLAYSALRDDGTSQAVFRLVGEDAAKPRRRSVR
jgi:hypothetical protein